MTYEQAGQFLDCHRNTIAEHVRVLNAIRIAPADLAAFIAGERR